MISHGWCTQAVKYMSAAADRALTNLEAQEAREHSSEAIKVAEQSDALHYRLGPLHTRLAQVQTSPHSHTVTQSST